MDRRVYDQKRTGKNIRYLRERHGLSMEELAGMLDYTTQFIGMAERGQRGFHLKRLMVVACLFHVTIDELLFQDLPAGKVAPSEFDAHERKVMEITTYIKFMTLAEVNFIAQFMRSLKAYGAAAGKGQPQ